MTHDVELCICLFRAAESVTCAILSHKAFGNCVYRDVHQEHKGVKKLEMSERGALCACQITDPCSRGLGVETLKGITPVQQVAHRVAAVVKPLEYIPEGLVRHIFPVHACTHTLKSAPCSSTEVPLDGGGYDSGCGLPLCTAGGMCPIPFPPDARCSHPRFNLQR